MTFQALNHACASGLQRDIEVRLAATEPARFASAAEAPSSVNGGQRIARQTGGLVRAWRLVVHLATMAGSRRGAAELPERAVLN